MLESSLVPLVLVMNESFFLPYSLEASRGFFSRYVIYNHASTDNTLNIIDWFIESCKGQNITFFVRNLPFCQPVVQGCFRNSMSAEAISDYTFILDGDELYSPESYVNLIKGVSLLKDNNKLYGVVRRVELNEDLTKAWGTTKYIKHHRLYDRKAVFKGSHPGEVPLFPQNSDTEITIPDVTCFHFHGAARSPKDSEVPKRIERRNRPTYQPGDLHPIDIIKELPILRTPINNFEVNPKLKELQNRLIL